MMRLYDCKALDVGGRVVERMIFAARELNFLEAFKKLGLTFISKKERHSTIRQAVVDFTLPFFRGLLQLVRNNLNLISALDIVKSSFQNAEARLIIATIKDNIKSGSSFANTLVMFGNFFDNTVVKTIEISEKTARLPEALSRVVEHLESSIKLKNKLKDALRYPLFLLICMFSVFIFWLFVIIPKFAELFDELNVTPPYISKIVFNLSYVIRENAWGAVVIALVIAGLWRWKRFSGILGKIPVMSKIKHETAIFNFCSSMEIMLHEKVNLLEALKCLDKEFLGIKNAIAVIESGSSLSVAIAASEIFNKRELSIISTGERAGDLWSAFKSIAEISRQRIDTTLQRISSLLQPVAICFAGLLLVLVVCSLITPLYSSLDLFT
ncbi:MAG: type II secretion system F family protein [Alphaproteobacteria bacterium]|nr:type II secretion system F family protein [Alphaproteobacteria bacterium]